MMWDIIELIDIITFFIPDGKKKKMIKKQNNISKI